MDPVAGATKAAQVLPPGSRLAVFWHAFQLPPQVAEAFAAVYQRVVPDSPFSFQAMPKKAIDGYRTLFTIAENGIKEVGRFDDPEQWQFDWEITYTREAWLDRMPTSGALTQLPPDKLTPVLDGTGDAIDAMGGQFTM